MNTPHYENPPSLGKPLGSYSHVATAGDMVFVAGQVGITADGEIPTDLGDQVKLTYANLRLALESQGLGVRNIVKFTTYLVDEKYIPDFFAARNEIFAELFPDGSYPPNTLLVISRLVEPELKVEIEAIAHR